MADWTNITDSQVDPDAPLTSELAYAWRDNVIAAFEAAPGAPGLAVGGLQRLEVGDVPRYVDAPERSTTSDTYTGQVNPITWMQAGDIRLSFDHRISGTTAWARLRRNRAGVSSTLYEVSVPSAAAWTSRTVDFSVEVGDLTFLQFRTQSSSAAAYFRNVEFKTSGGRIWPFGDTDYLKLVF